MRKRRGSLPERGGSVVASYLWGTWLGARGCVWLSSLALGGAWTGYGAVPAIPDSLSAIRVASDVSEDVPEGVSTSFGTWDAFWGAGTRHRVVDRGWGFSMRAGRTR